MKKLCFLFLALALGTLSALNIADYGAGPMLKPARTFYVSTKGSNKNDGTTLAKAFRSIDYGVSKLRAGDTLLIEGGTYFEPEIQINVKEETIGYSLQCGKPGSPIRIMGMKGHTVKLHGGIELPRPAKKDGTVYKFKYNHPLRNKKMHELPSGIELQYVPSEKVVREYPGTFYYDAKNKELLVNFAAVDQTGVSVYNRRVGIRIHGSYIHLENLTFSYYSEPIYVRMNRPYDKNKASHITIQNCNFFYNTKTGILLDGASWSLVKNNRGAYNTERGNFLNLDHAHDNLTIGNWSGPTSMTLRQMPLNDINFGINSYVGNPPRNHVVANLIESDKAFRWKGAGAGNIFEDNIVCGTFHVESKPQPVTIRNNYFARKLSWPGICGWSGWEKDFKGSPVKFYDNTLRLADFKPKNKAAIEEAKKLKLVLPKPKFPEVTFKDLRADSISNDSAAIFWETPGCDGWARVELLIPGQKQRRVFTSPVQGMRHVTGITGLKPGTSYTYRAGFRSRRGGKTVWSKPQTFTTAKTVRAPKVIEVGPGKYTLEAAAAEALPGDTVKLLPGVHSGRFIPLRSGLPGKPITLSGKGATIDALGFYSPSITLSEKKHIVIDGITFKNADITSNAHVIVVRDGSHITIKNCRMIDLDWRAGNFITLSRTPNSVIYNNVIQGGSYPICISGGGVKILNNTIVDATMLSLLLWGPFDIEIRNNIFYRPCIEKKRNTALLLNYAGKNIVSDGNVYWSPFKHHPIGGRIRDDKLKVTVGTSTLADWQKATGFDKTSVHIDPQFVDYAQGDYRLKSTSPVKGKGAVL